MKESPLVSIYIPTKNRRIFLDRCLNSIRNQDYENLEILVVNDGSEDDTDIYLEEVAKKDKRIRIFKNKTSLGPSASRNLAILKATGHFITGCDDDDYFLPNRISFLVKNWNQNYSFITTNRISWQGKIEETEQWGIGLINLESMNTNNLVGNQIFIETKRLREEELFDEAMPAWVDYEFWYRLIKRLGPAYKFDSPSYYLDRSRDDRISLNESKIENAFRLMVKKHFSDAPKKQLLLKLVLLRNTKANFSIKDLLGYFKIGLFWIPIKIFIRKLFP